MAHGDARPPALAVAEPGGERGRGGGEEQLRGAEAEHQRAHRLEPRQAEFEADREHQEDDAELGQAVHIPVFGENFCAVRSQRDADGEIGQDRRQAQAARDGDRADRRGQQQEDGEQVLVHGRPGALNQPGG